jgi:dihydroorotate dehydrogenase
MLNKPAFYDPLKSYDDNYTAGPPILSQNIEIHSRDLTKAKSFTFLGQKVSLPFGIPPGPLLNSTYMEAAFNLGFDVSTYKTVRSDTFPCHSFPNVLYVNTPQELHPDQTPRLTATDIAPSSIDKITITNSFGVPSKPVEYWQNDVKKALTYVKEGQAMILSFMGTVKEGQSQDEFIEDFGKAGRLSAETKVKVLEANLSCPNIGNEGLVCYNLDVTEAVAQAIRKQISDLPLILKIGYFKDDLQLKKLAQIANKYAGAIAAINTLQVEIVNDKGEQALPGKNRMKSGVCGASIKWAGLEMVERLRKIREKNNYSFEIVGIGGVMNAHDYFDYRKAGADLVQSATGAMWDPMLAYTIWKAENTI